MESLGVVNWGSRCGELGSMQEWETGVVQV